MNPEEKTSNCAFWLAQNDVNNHKIINHFFPLDLQTYYINFQFSNMDGKGGPVNVRIQHSDFPDKSIDVPLNAVMGSTIQLTANSKPSPVKVSAKDTASGDIVLINGDSVHEVEFLEEPIPVYIALGDGATGWL